MIILDAGFFVALARQNDESHSRADEIERELAEGGESLFFTESVLGEFASLLAKRDSPRLAHLKAEQLLQSRRLTLILSTGLEVAEAPSLLGQYGFSSYSDALSVSVMKSRGIKKIVSFDSDFDRAPGIKRIF